MLTKWDRQRIHGVMAGKEDDFYSQLARLVPKADLSNRAKLREAFPTVVEAVEWWMGHSHDQWDEEE